MATTNERSRSWKGPALFSFGFRPFFLGAAIWAVVSMVVWLGMLAGFAPLPIATDPVSWHVHEFLFGYLGAVMAGFLLTAVPNWTGRLPVVGWPLAWLFVLWLLGRAAFAFAELLPLVFVAIVDLAFPTALVAFLAREILIGRNWRNLIVLAILILFLAGNAMSHWAGMTISDAGHRVGLAAAVMLIAVIGGRVVPSFTRNWLVKAGETRLPTPPMQVFDKVALMVILVALTAWILAPGASFTVALLFVAGLLHAARLARWRGYLTGREALVWSLHLGYAFVPLGAVFIAAATLAHAPQLVAAGQHVWTIGAVGIMTLAIMTRATLGHTKGTLHAGAGTTLIYLAIVGATLARLATWFLPSMASALYTVAGVSWCAAFVGFTVLYGPRLLRRQIPAN